MKFFLLFKHHVLIEFAYRLIGVAAISMPLLAPQAVFGLDLISAIREVDSKHPLIQAKRLELEATQGELSIAKQQRLPSLSVVTNRSSNENSRTYVTTRLQQPLYAGGRIQAGIRQAEGRIDESEAVLALARRDLTRKTAQTFYEVLKGEDRLAVSNRSVQAHKLLMESISRRVRAEVSPESDLLLTQSRLLQAETERAQIQLALDRSKDVLRELTDRPVSSDLVFVARPPLAIDLTQALADAEHYAPEIRQLQAQEVVATQEIDLQKSTARPSVFARYEYLSSERDPGLVREQTYLGFEFTPGSGLSVAQQIKAAESRRLAAIEARRGSERELRERVRTIWFDIASLRSQVPSLEEYMKTARGVSESFARQFAIGRKSWVEVLNATREHFQAELIFADTQWNLRTSEVLLEIELGRLNPDALN